MTLVELLVSMSITVILISILTVLLQQNFAFEKDALQSYRQIAAYNLVNQRLLSECQKIQKSRNMLGEWSDYKINDPVTLQAIREGVLLKENRLELNFINHMIDAHICGEYCLQFHKSKNIHLTNNGKLLIRQQNLKRLSFSEVAEITKNERMVTVKITAPLLEPYGSKVNLLKLAKSEYIFSGKGISLSKDNHAKRRLTTQLRIKRLSSFANGNGELTLSEVGHNISLTEAPFMGFHIVWRGEKRPLTPFWCLL